MISTPLGCVFIFCALIFIRLMSKVLELAKSIECCVFLDWTYDENVTLRVCNYCCQYNITN